MNAKIPEKIHIHELRKTCTLVTGEPTCYGEAYRELWRRKADGKLFAYTDWGSHTHAEEVLQ